MTTYATASYNNVERLLLVVEENEWGYRMKHGIISAAGFDFLSAAELSFNLYQSGESQDSAMKEWEDRMGSRGFALCANIDVLKELFRIVNDRFAEEFGEYMAIQLWEGYLTRERGQKKVKHNDAHRIFSETRCVYVDMLMSQVLFVYAATYYTWARYEDCEDISFECFRQALFNYNACCREGELLGTDGKMHLVNLGSADLKDWEIALIGDLYWCMLAFALCHEVAHIYLKHNMPSNLEEAHIQEYEADKTGYDIFLKLMIRYMHSSEDVVPSIFQENMYAAPMILFLFYHDLFVVDAVLHNEEKGNTHPFEQARIDRLLDISQSNEYDFDSRDGNIILEGFYRVSDAFCSVLKSKLAQGTLNKFTGKGI